MDESIVREETVFSPGMTGTYYQTIDAKGRLSIPVRIIRDLADSFYIAEGAKGRFLTVIPKDAWMRRAAKLAAVPMTDAAAQKAIRRMFATTQACDVDNSGRVQLSEHLREYAKLQKDIVIIGSNERAEIWAKEIWDQQFAEDLDDEADISALTEYGI